MEKFKKIPKDILIISALFLLLPFIVIPQWVYEYSTQKHLIFALFFTVMAVFYLFSKKKETTLSLGWPHKFLLLFGISVLVSLVSSFITNRQHFTWSLENAAYTVLVISVCFIITNRFGKDMSFIEMGLLFFMIGGTIIAFDGLLNKFTGYDLFFGKYGDPNERLTLRTTIGNPNFVSDYLAQLLPISVYFILKKDSSKLLKVYNFINIFLFYWVILLTQTRSIFLGFFVGLVFAFVCLIINLRHTEDKKYFTSKNFLLKTFSIIAILVFLFVMFSMPTFFNKEGEIIPSNRFNAASTVSSWDERSLSWLASVEQFLDKDNPQNLFIGGGIGTYQIYAVKYMGIVQNKNPERFLYAWNNFKRTHNDYLQVLGETGIFGFISIMGLLISLLFMYFRSLSKLRDTNKLLLMCMFGWTAVIIVLHSFTEFPLHLQPNLALSLFILSAAVSPQFMSLKEYKIKKINVLISIVIFFGIVSVIFKINSNLSEILFKYGNTEYAKLDYYYDAAQNKIPQAIEEVNNNISQLKKKLQSSVPGSSDFIKISNDLKTAQGQIEKLEVMKSEYLKNSYTAYSSAIDYFNKSLDFNPNFGKSAFYLAQMLTKSPFRYQDLTYDTLNTAFELSTREYKHLVPYFKGNVSLMPFSTSNIRSTVKDLYGKSESEEFKVILVSIQSIYDEIDMLKTAFISFNEKNSYKLIPKLYFEVIRRYELLKDYCDQATTEIIEKMEKSDLSEFMHWYDKAIEILPGGWNRFPEWEQTYSEYLYFLTRMTVIFPEEVIMPKILEVIEKDGKANYYMAKKTRGIPDSSLTVLEEFLSSIQNSENKSSFINGIISNYSQVYDFYRQAMENGDSKYLSYKDRVDSFLSTYEFFLRRK
ncbi:MAG TPA: O-antigen ligase family protein [Petrotogaceae bacterium]|nr:O-antigen ligase family protein [Petrotogaceae bacterium]